MVAHEIRLLSLVNLDCGSIAEKCYSLESYHLTEVDLNLVLETLPQSWSRLPLISILGLARGDCVFFTS